ncbi:MAG: insulinase family protein [Christensenellaceae bacterium]|jgi:predicted Zn-dependent peptidase|nr:insulinase family protein [Christensenellaceae bacterium]
MGKIINFDSGLRLILNTNTKTKSVSVGVYVANGSAFEDPTVNGISHFIEHMCFKGTVKRSPLDIAEEMESIGAQINAFTGRMVTAYYSTSLSEHIEKCIDVLSDIFFNATFTDENIKKEQKVILEEISMCEDDPQTLCHDLFFLAHFGAHPLGFSILGTKEIVSSMTRDKLLDYMKERYYPAGTVVSISGNIQKEEARKLVEKYFESNLVKSGKKLTPVSKVRSKSGILLKRIKPTEQSHIAFTFPALNSKSRELQAEHVLSNVLGGGMSSRLFQKIREDRGLAYDVYSSSYAFTNNGLFVISLATNPSNVEQAVGLVKTVLIDLLQNGITESELNKGKEQIKTGLVLGVESSSALMRYSADRLLFDCENFKLKKHYDDVQKVTIEDVNALAKNIFDFNKVSAAYVGPEIDVNILEAIKA